MPGPPAIGTNASFGGSSVSAGTTATLNSIVSEPGSDGSSGRNSVPQRAAMLVVPGPASMRQSLSSRAGSAEVIAENNNMIGASLGIVFLLRTLGAAIFATG